MKDASLHDADAEYATAAALAVMSRIAGWQQTACQLIAADLLQNSVQQRYQRHLQGTPHCSTAYEQRHLSLLLPYMASAYPFVVCGCEIKLCVPVVVWPGPMYVEYVMAVCGKRLLPKYLQ